MFAFLAIAVDVSNKEKGNDNASGRTESFQSFVTLMYNVYS